MKNKYVKVLLAVLVMAMVTVTGCGGDPKDRKNEASEEEDEDEDEDEEEEEETPEEEKERELGEMTVENQYHSWFPFGEVLAFEGNEVLYSEPSSKLDVEAVYKKIKMTPEFFYGKYYLLDRESPVSTYDPPQKYIDEAEWKDLKEYVGYVNYSNLYDGHEITTMPYYFEAGTESYFSNVHGIPGYNWCGLYFAERDPDRPGSVLRYEVPAAYEINGNKITFHLMTEYDYDLDTNSLDYKFGNKVIEYTFERGPISLTLSNGSQTVEMLSADFLDRKNDLTGARLQGKNTSGELVAGLPITELSVFADQTGKGHSSCEVEGSSYTKTAATFTEDGLLTLCMEIDDKVETRQFLCFDCNEDGVILCDEDGIYRLISMDRWSEETYGTMTVNNIRPEDMEAFGKLSQESIELLNSKKNDLVEDLIRQINEAGLPIEVNTETGEIVFDSAILFAHDSSEISDDGKKMLALFSLGFADVLQQDEYKGFLKEIVISGHTDSDGSYEYNKKLSLARAEAVMNYCLEVVGEGEAREMFEEILTAEGCSYDNLIYDENGEEDKAASRRVVFSFYVNIDALQ